MDERNGLAEALCSKAEDALIELDFERALQAVARMRDDCDPTSGPVVAVGYLKVLWIETFIRRNIEEDPFDGEYHRAAAEIGHLAQDSNSQLPLGAQCAASLVSAQSALIESRYPKALAFLRSMLSRPTTQNRIRELAPRPLLPAEKVEAAMIVDAYGELARLVQRFHVLPFGISHRRAHDSRDLLSDGLLDSLMAHADLSRWSRRRTFARLAYEAITQGKREDGRRLLNASRASLPEDLAESPLAGLEDPVMRFYDELARDDGEFDQRRAGEALDAAAAHFDRVGFHRREADLEIEAELLQIRLR